MTSIHGTARSCDTREEAWAEGFETGLCRARTPRLIIVMAFLGAVFTGITLGHLFTKAMAEIAYHNIHYSAGAGHE
jgi:hypothetical protein